jgi:hypothetical protein
MKTLHTISDREIKVTPNHSRNTFTIRTSAAKYRTLPMSKYEFNNANRNWTGNDWQQFLKTDEYYKVK